MSLEKAALKSGGCQHARLGLAAPHVLRLRRQDPINAFAAVFLFLKNVSLLKLEKLELRGFFRSGSFSARGFARRRSAQRAEAGRLGSGSGVLELRASTQLHPSAELQPVSPTPSPV